MVVFNDMDKFLGKNSSAGSHRGDVDKDPETPLDSNKN